MATKELSLNEMEEVVGGRGGSPRKLPARKGWEVIKIEKGATLGRIAREYHTTVDYLFRNNDTITNKNDITAGYYMYVPAGRK